MVDCHHASKEELLKEVGIINRTRLQSVSMPYDADDGIFGSAGGDLHDSMSVKTYTYSHSPYAESWRGTSVRGGGGGGGGGGENSASVVRGFSSRFSVDDRTEADEDQLASLIESAAGLSSSKRSIVITLSSNIFLKNISSAPMSVLHGDRLISQVSKEEK